MGAARQELKAIPDWGSWVDSLNCHNTPGTSADWTHKAATVREVCEGVWFQHLGEFGRMLDVVVKRHISRLQPFRLRS
jgi:hypothetical protein